MMRQEIFEAVEAVRAIMPDERNNTDSFVVDNLLDPRSETDEAATVIFSSFRKLSAFDIDVSSRVEAVDGICTGADEFGMTGYQLMFLRWDRDPMLQIQLFEGGSIFAVKQTGPESADAIEVDPDEDIMTGTMILGALVTIRAIES